VGEGRLTTGWGAGRRGRRGNENAETPACAKASAGRRRRGDSSRPASKSGYCGATTLIFRASCGSWRGFRSGLSVVRPTDRRVYPHSTLDGLPRAVDIPTSRDFGRPGRARAPDAGRAKAVSRSAWGAGHNSSDAQIVRPFGLAFIWVHIHMGSTFVAFVSFCSSPLRLPVCSGQNHPPDAIHQPTAGILRKSSSRIRHCS